MGLAQAMGISGPALLGGTLAAAFLVAVGASTSALVSADDAAAMSLSVSGSSVECTADECKMAAGGTFMLTVNADSVPDSGYLLVQSFIDYGPDLTYIPTKEQVDEVIWPDCAEGVAVRYQITSETVNHGCLSGLIPPLPLSDYAGPVFEIELTCSEEFSSTSIQLLPFGHVLADTSGAQFAIELGVGVSPKLSPVTVICGEAPPDVPVDVVLPATGNAPLSGSDGGPIVVLWFVIGTLAVAGVAGISACGWREACRRQSQ